MKEYTIQDLASGNLKNYASFRTCIWHKGQIMFLDTPVFGKKVDTGVKEIRGTIAQKGVVRGIVRIVKKVSEVENVQKGDILVTQMTFPSFIAAMKRARAFVTDEGGITCHAAIVARELQKPCIIGTKIATKVLKDGDLVEVNADEGVVKILEDA